jgi:glycosyltransferase involved in cell wall biosynthesis
MIRRACDELVREAPVDVVSVQQPLPGYAATRSPGLMGVPFSYGFHSPWHVEYEFKVKVLGPRNPFLRWVGWYALNGRVRRHMEHQAVMRSRNVILLSEFSRNLIGRIHGFPPERVFRIPGGVDERRFAPVGDRTETRRRLGLPEDRTLLLTVRNLRPRMGLSNLIDAMVRVAREAPSAFLLIGGAGALKAELKAQARRLGLEEHVRFCGYVAEDDLSAYYNAADFFVLPTEFLEGFGMVTLEALSCGTPVLGTPVGATPEVLKPLDESLLFPDASPDGMAASIIRHVRAIE